MRFVPKQRLIPRRNKDELRTSKKAILEICEILEQAGYRAIPFGGDIRIDRDLYVVAESAIGYPTGPVLMACYHEAHRAAPKGRVPIGVAMYGHVGRREALACVALSDLMAFIEAWADAPTLRARLREAESNALRRPRPKSPRSIGSVQMPSPGSIHHPGETPPRERTGTSSVGGSTADAPWDPQPTDGASPSETPYPSSSSPEEPPAPAP